jgi:hypothetical protein
VQPVPVDGAVQFKTVPVLVVEDEVNPVGAPGTVVQVLVGVVTLTDALCADAPAASEAATAKLNMCPAVKPLTWKLVLVVVPSDAPFSKTV